MRIEERLSRALVETHPADAAAVVERLSPQDAVASLQRFPASIVVEVFRALVPATAAGCLAAWPETEVGNLLAALPRETAATLLARLGDAQRARLLARAPRKTSEALRRLLLYPEGTAGALMDPHVTALPQEITVAEARKRVRRATDHVLYYLYVVDREQRLVGVLNLRELMAAAPESEISAIMHTEVAHVSVHAGCEAILAHPGWREHHALPVTDARDGLVGVLRYETLRRLEADRDRGRGPMLLELGISLGELYWTAVFRLARELAAIESSALPATKKKEGRHGGAKC